MKKTLLFITAFMPLFLMAQSGFTYLVPSGGMTIQGSPILKMGIEYNNRYYEGWEIAFEATLKSDMNNEESYLTGVYFEPLLFRKKDVLSNLRFGVLGGSQQQTFAMAAGAGIELSFVLKGNIIFSIQQDTKMVFGADRIFRHGLLAVIKFPI
tara:strand:+ start:3481 stop:3939 length:459 start_codon:yes stop_codon:yes gene_type:complete